MIKLAITNDRECFMNQFGLSINIGLTKIVPARHGDEDSTTSTARNHNAVGAIFVRTNHRASKIPAAPIPVPTHIVTMPYFNLRRRKP